MYSLPKGVKVKKERSVFEQFGVDVSKLIPHQLLEKMKRDTVYVDYPELRHMILHDMGLRRTIGSENMIITGCICPFGMTLELLSYFRLLDRLGIKYTFIRDKEYCCGAPAVEAALPSEIEPILAGAKENMDLNTAQARELGAKKMFYFCYMCFTLGQKFYQGGDMPQSYFLDLILEKAEERTFRLPPAVIGYYEGCWRRPKAVYNGVKLNLEGYRRLLYRIEGIKIVELPHKTCCTLNPAHIYDTAERNKVDYIVTSCTVCWANLHRLVKRPTPLKFLPLVLNEALQD